MLREQFVGKDGQISTKLDIAIQRLKSFEPPEGYFVAFSGGYERPVTYAADFVYIDKDGHAVVEDAKGAKTQQYIIRRKLMLRKYGIEIKEV